MAWRDQLNLRVSQLCGMKDIHLTVIEHRWDFWRIWLIWFRNNTTELQVPVLRFDYSSNGHHSIQTMPRMPTAHRWFASKSHGFFTFTFQGRFSKELGRPLGSDRYFRYLHKALLSFSFSISFSPAHWIGKTALPWLLDRSGCSLVFRFSLMGNRRISYAEVFQREGW
jgi:hypothetical protein